jgi:hypothetical protein
MDTGATALVGTESHRQSPADASCAGDSKPALNILIASARNSGAYGGLVLGIFRSSHRPLGPKASRRQPKRVNSNSSVLVRLDGQSA